MLGGNLTHFCSMLHIIDGFVALVINSDTEFVPKAPDTFFCSTQWPPLVPQQYQLAYHPFWTNPQCGGLFAPKIASAGS